MVLFPFISFFLPSKDIFYNSDFNRAVSQFLRCFFVVIFLHFSSFPHFCVWSRFKLKLKTFNPLAHLLGLGWFHVFYLETWAKVTASVHNAYIKQLKFLRLKNLKKYMMEHIFFLFKPH